MPKKGKNKSTRGNIHSSVNMHWFKESVKRGRSRNKIAKASRRANR